ncbi:MAG: ATP-binding protein [Hyphomicrobium sp.]
MNVTRFPRAPSAAAQAAEASFLVNIQTGTVVGAGRLAATVLAWDATRTGGHQLDAAMPAVRRLRDFAQTNHETSPALEKLVLWGRRGAFAALCKLECASSGATHPLIRVTITNIQEILAQLTEAADHNAASNIAVVKQERPGRRGTILPSQAVQAVASDAGANLEAAVNVAPEVSPSRDDRMTLQLIALRIQEGIRLTAGTLPPDMAPAGGNGVGTGAPIPTSAFVVTDEPRAGLVPGQQPSPVDGARLGDDAVAAPIAVSPTCDVPVRLPPEAHVNSALTGNAVQLNAGRDALNLLLAQAAHDIKTPLSAISAASEIIRDERLGPAGNERYRAYAADIHASARHALAIVDRLMKLPPVPVVAPLHTGGSPKEDSGSPKEDIGGPNESSSRPHQRAGSPNPSDGQPKQSNSGSAKANAGSSYSAPTETGSSPLIDMNALVAGCVAELSPLTENHQLGVTVRLDPSQPRVGVDATGLKQSLLNVLTNAMKFTRAGGSIHVETERLPSKGLLISVRDTGHGMTKGAIARLLEVGSESAAISPTATGLGLGIPQVRAFCQANRAQLTIDSTLGRGTVVTILLSG